ncbi:glycosyltransferase family 2 protein [Dyadobacter sp. CY356]|uniref:glycosyltransferase family 2 protein n=1 Tax=Dyadobacter sp. CY356 TaxID=2906442 RepID=UPI001F24A407|nr:glycosyltransferase family 2 protein [Dyadobacter sp. CY356]MCF0055936.1 glycosyltransferase [Dyadobacter sp. CY356]
MTADFPKITIVTPSYNQGKYLEDTILSVLGQGYPNLEYIIIDGGSTDDSVAIIKKYENQLAYWVSEKDEGLYHGLQKGFAKSTGEIMAWLNADDMYHKKSLFLVVDLFEKFKEVHWLMGSNTFFDESGYPFTYDDQPYAQRWSQTRLLLFNGHFIQQESVFWRRGLWEKAGGFISQDYSLAADFELWIRFFRYEKLYSTSFMLSGFRFRNENQKSFNQRNQYLEQVYALTDQEKKISPNLHLRFCRLLISLTKLIPKRKWREKIIANILQLPPKIIFDRNEGFVFSKR